MSSRAATVASTARRPRRRRRWRWDWNNLVSTEHWVHFCWVCSLQEPNLAITFALTCLSTQISVGMLKYYAYHWFARLRHCTTVHILGWTGYEKKMSMKHNVCINILSMLQRTMAGVFKLFPGDPNFSIKILRDPKQTKTTNWEGELAELHRVSRSFGLVWTHAARAPQNLRLLSWKIA